MWEMVEEFWDGFETEYEIEFQVEDRGYYRIFNDLEDLEEFINEVTEVNYGKYT